MSGSMLIKKIEKNFQINQFYTWMIQEIYLHIEQIYL